MKKPKIHATKESAQRKVNALAAMGVVSEIQPVDGGYVVYVPPYKIHLKI